jgi:hypothetical protein
MKTYLKPILLLLCCTAFTACDEEESAEQPIAAVAVDKYIYETNESMTVRFTGSAENVVIYTGDTDHDYTLREQSNYGLVVNKGVFTYSYSQPGTYRVVCVATNHRDAGSDLKRDTCSFSVRVVDDVNTIDRLSASQVYYDEVFGSAINDSDWKLVLPRKVRYNKKDITISMASQRLKFYIASDSAKVLVSNAAYTATKRYNLNSPLDISVTSHEGMVRAYKLYTLNFGEFKSYTVGGVTATLNRSEYDYSNFELSVPQPFTENTMQLSPTFTLYSDNDKVYIDGVEQVSGQTVVDFSQPVTYTIVTTYPDRPDITAESKVTVVLQ